MDLTSVMLEKYKNIIPYAVFGVLTTALNTFLYWICRHVLMLSVLPSTIVAWFIAVLFSYLTNRKWVFHSYAENGRDVLKEAFSFFVCRLGTGVFDGLAMWIYVNLVNQGDVLFKLAVNVVVIILNYVASKFVIFKKH